MRHVPHRYVVFEDVWACTQFNKSDTFAPRVLTQEKLLALRGCFSDIAGNDSQRFSRTRRMILLAFSWNWVEANLRWAAIWCTPKEVRQHDLGGRRSNFRTTDKNAYRQDGRLARFRHLDPNAGEISSTCQHRYPRRPAVGSMRAAISGVIVTFASFSGPN